MTLRDDTDRKAPAVKLTENMRTVLERAKKQALQRRHTDTPGAPPWPAHHSTLRRLVELELVTYIERDSRAGNRLELWEITPAGVQALEPAPVKPSPDRDVYLAPGSGTTPNPHRSIDYDIHPATGIRTSVPQIDPDILNPSWRAEAERRHRQAADLHKEHVRSIRALRRAA